MSLLKCSALWDRGLAVCVRVHYIKGLALLFHGYVNLGLFQASTVLGE